MAYKFKVGDKASFAGKEGRVVEVDKGSTLTYCVEWDSSKPHDFSWFRGRELDKVYTSITKLVVGQEVEVIHVVPGQYGVRLESKTIAGPNYNFPAQSLQLVRRKPEYKEMKISKDYSAKIYSDKIEVGCQTITIENFRKLQKLVDEMDK